jgi:hypothetical protein
MPYLGTGVTSAIFGHIFGRFFDHMAGRYLGMFGAGCAPIFVRIETGENDEAGAC